MQPKLRYTVVGPIQTNVYFYSDEDTKEAVIVDPGDEAEKLKGLIAKHGLKPVAVLLTHGHFDHILAADSLREAYGIPVYACEKEQALLADPQLNHSHLFGPPLRLAADKWVKDGDVLPLAGFQLRVLETPGHSAGSCCYYDEENGMLFSGDTLFRESYGRTDLPTGSEEAIVRSVQRLLNELPADTQVFPGHMSFSTIAYERQWNPLAGGEGV